MITGSIPPSERTRPRAARSLRYSTGIGKNIRESYAADSDTVSVW
jgi:hypothetical protein